METQTVNLIMNGCIFLGLWFIFYYQNSKISSLKTTIDSQKSILDSAQKFIEIFNLDTVEKYVRITEDTIRQETDKKVMEAEERVKKVSVNWRNNMDYIIKKMAEKSAQWYGASFVMLMSIMPKDREKVIERISEGDIKNQLKELNEEYKDTFYPPNPKISNFIESLFNLPMGGGDAA